MDGVVAILILYGLFLAVPAGYYIVYLVWRYRFPKPKRHVLPYRVANLRQYCEVGNASLSLFIAYHAVAEELFVTCNCMLSEFSTA
jgi:hypothetical protein